LAERGGNPVAFTPSSERSYRSVGRLNIMLNERKMMSATCISTRGSEAARCEVSFTYFILDP
jgi:hypothetical protein